MYRRIFVPVDGSAVSRLARDHAISLAQTQRGRVRFLHVVDESLGLSRADIVAVDMSGLLRRLWENGEKTVAEAASLARRKGVRADTSLLQVRGRHVSDVILAEAKKWRADLIVMGTHGTRGVSQLLLGSDAERVLQETPAPLLLVRAEHAKMRATKRARKSR
jgi:nucleotide-binding universal stress UspA family protein